MHRVLVRIECYRFNISMLHMTLCARVPNPYPFGYEVYLKCTGPHNFWLPAACGSAALEANITLVLLLVMSFT